MIFYNLANEYNLPTFYQSIKTLLAGGLLLMVLSRRIKLNKWVIIAGFILIYFAFDDWFAIHEAISNHSFSIAGIERRLSWIIFYLPILLLAVFAFWKLYQKIKLNRLIMIGVFLLALAFGLEIAEAVNHENKYIFYQISAEESLEMFGITTILMAILIKMKDRRQIQKDT